jgi:hypothetical protein
MPGGSLWKALRAAAAGMMPMAQTVPKKADARKTAIGCKKLATSNSGQGRKGRQRGPRGTCQVPVKARVLGAISIWS